MKTKLNTKLIALFIAFLLCFVVLLSPFAVFKADAETLETEEPQQNITTSTVQRVFDFSFCKEAMGLNEASAKNKLKRSPLFLIMIFIAMKRIMPISMSPIS